MLHYEAFNDNCIQFNFKSFLALVSTRDKDRHTNKETHRYTKTQTLIHTHRYTHTDTQRHRH